MLHNYFYLIIIDLDTEKEPEHWGKDTSTIGTQKSKFSEAVNTIQWQERVQLASVFDIFVSACWQQYSFTPILFLKYI